MDFDFSEETCAFRDLAAAFARAEFAPNASAWDAGSLRQMIASSTSRRTRAWRTIVPRMSGSAKRLVTWRATT